MGKRGTFAVGRDDLDGGKRAVPHGGDKVGRID